MLQGTLAHPLHTLLLRKNGAQHLITSGFFALSPNSFAGAHRAPDQAPGPAFLRGTQAELLQGEDLGAQGGLQGGGAGGAVLPRHTGAGGGRAGDKTERQRYVSIMNVNFAN